MEFRLSDEPGGGQDIQGYCGGQDYLSVLQGEIGKYEAEGPICEQD